MAGAVRPIAADGVRVGDLAIQGVAGRLLGQVLEESGVEDDDVGNLGQQAAADLNTLKNIGLIVLPAENVTQLKDICTLILYYNYIPKEDIIGISGKDY